MVTGQADGAQPTNMGPYRVPGVAAQYIDRHSLTVATVTPAGGILKICNGWHLVCSTRAKKQSNNLR
jgi:hypothetical protein